MIVLMGPYGPGRRLRCEPIELLVPQGGFEPPLPAPEAGALSPELLGRGAAARPQRTECTKAAALLIVGLSLRLNNPR